MTDEQYHNLITSHTDENPTIDPNTLYVVQSDNINAYGSRVINVEDAKEDTDAVNKKQVNEISGILNDKIDDVNDDILSTISSVSSTINDKINDVNENLTSSVLSVSENLDSYINSITNEIGDLSVKLENKISIDGDNISSLHIRNIS